MIAILIVAIVAAAIAYLTLLFIAAGDLVNESGRGGRVILPDWLVAVVMVPLVALAWAWRQVAKLWERRQ